MFDVARSAVDIAGWKEEHGVGKNRRLFERLKNILINSCVPLHSCERTLL